MIRSSLAHWADGGARRPAEPRLIEDGSPYPRKLPSAYYAILDKRNAPRLCVPILREIVKGIGRQRRWATAPLRRSASVPIDYAFASALMTLHRAFPRFTSANFHFRHGGRFLPRSLLAAIPALGWPALSGATTEVGDIVAVYSSVSPDYSRARLADGGFKAETYAFGEGGHLTGEINDRTIDPLSFLDVAHVIAPTLAQENYFPCDPRDPRSTNLLILVYWGTTIGTDRTSTGAEYQIARALTPPPLPPAIGPMPTEHESGRTGALQTAADNALQESSALVAMANRQRDRQNAANATILGYLAEMNRMSQYQTSARRQQRQDLVDEIEESRYYVVLLAYDFQTLRQHQGRKLLWETRFSLPRRRNSFANQLAAMAQAASRYYGKTSEGLLRKPLPTGHVELGEARSLGAVR